MAARSAPRPARPKPNEGAIESAIVDVEVNLSLLKDKLDDLREKRHDAVLEADNLMSLLGELETAMTAAPDAVRQVTEGRDSEKNLDSGN
jgi:hypothetical protein